VFLSIPKKILLLLTLIVLTGCGWVDLNSGLSEREANEMMSLLHQRTIDVKKSVQSDGLFLLQVSEEDKVAAIAILANHGLPRKTRQACTELYKKKGSIIRSPTEERERVRCNMQMGIEDILSHLEGVVTARVQLVLPVSDPMTESKKKASASVLLKTRYDIELGARNEIKKLVADAVPGLEYPNVTLKIDQNKSMLDKSNDMKQIENIRLENKSRKHPATGAQFYMGIGGVLLILAAIAVLLYRRGRNSQLRELDDTDPYEEDQLAESGGDPDRTLGRDVGMDDPLGLDHQGGRAN